MDSADLRKNQGPLAKHFTPQALDERPLVSEVVNSENVTGSQKDGDLYDVLHFADWGSCGGILNALGHVLADHPGTKGALRIMRKVDGEVLHIIRIE